MSNSTMDDVLARHTPALMSIVGVVGTGRGEHDGHPCILVFVNEKNDDVVRDIPHELEGYPVCVEEVGEIGPLA